MLHYLMILSFLLTLGCEGENGKGGPSSGRSYDFSAAASAELSSTQMSLHAQGLALAASGAEHLCKTGETITCAAPSELTGKYFAAGLLIQAGGSGMQSYLLSDNFSDVSSTSTSYNFDMKTPITSTGNLRCCGGSGDLTSTNTYFSEASFLFSYIDAAFKIPYSNPNQVANDMTGTHTVRFVLTTDPATSYKRGDLLYKDADGVFKWMSTGGALSATRPASPLTMDRKVVNYIAEFEPKIEIPLIQSQILSPAGGDEKVTTSEAELKAEGMRYSFDFNADHLIVITLAPSELSIIQTREELFKRIHLQGLPHSTFTFGTSAASILTISE